MEEATVSILLAHEEPLFRELLREVLELEPDLEVCGEAGDGLEAVAQAKVLTPDLALVSAHLPRGEGTRTMSAIKELLPECRVVLVNDREDQELLLAALEAGASGYLTKRSTSHDLIQAARSSAAGDIAVPGDMQTNLIVQLVDRLKERDEAIGYLSTLTAREKDVLALLFEGSGTDAIAQHLVISPETARTHIQNVLEKLGVHSRLEAVALVRKDVGLGRLLQARGPGGPSGSSSVGY
jgi:DNA-binding NarL/FixJ family response regulator